MALDLRELIAGTVSNVPFAFEGSSDGYSDDILQGTVRANGLIENHAGFIFLKGEIVLQGTFRCARCCKEFPQEIRFPMDYKIAESLANEDEEEFLLLEDGQLDLEETIRSQLYTEMPYRFLCKSDCKGLCPKCGKDLNEETCSCNLKEIDPRWSALSGYFEEEK